VSRRELDAAGIVEPRLRASYEHCRRLNAVHGRTYYLATLLLPPGKRPYVHALYGFARHADEIVDDLDPALGATERAARLEEWGARFLTDLRAGVSADPVGGAVLHTARRWGIPPGRFEEFLAAMRMDLAVSEYRDYDDLMRYVWGSAAVIGLQMLPILEPVVDAAVAEPYAVDLGVAFQLSNFIRDVGEDLRRGRVYLPMADMAHFGVDRERLARGVVDDAIRRLLAYEIARTRELYRSAEPGIRLLHPTSRDCIRTALRLYRGILDEVERADSRVLDRRVSVGPARRLAVAVPALVRATVARRRQAGRRGGC
jgi:15-cis-phytoene synthase